MPKTKTSHGLRNKKLLILIAILLLIPLAIFAYNKYLDWDNAQMIKGLSRDFPLLVEEIESATGLDLEVKSNCQQTQEKLESGVSICEYTFTDGSVTEDTIERVEQLVLNSDNFGLIEYKQSVDAYKISYRSNYSCDLSGGGTIYFSCVTAVRDANKPRLNELLNQTNR